MGDLCAAWGAGLGAGAAVAVRAASTSRTAEQFARVAAQWLRVLSSHPGEAATLPGSVDLSPWAGRAAWAAVEAGFELGAALGTVAALGARMSWTRRSAGRAGEASGFGAALAVPWDPRQSPGQAASDALGPAMLGPLATRAAAAGLHAAFAEGAARGVERGCRARAPEARAHLRPAPPAQVSPAGRGGPTRRAVRPPPGPRPA